MRNGFIVMLMSQLTRRILPMVLIAAALSSATPSRAQDSAVEYAVAGYQQVDTLCLRFVDQLLQWRNAPASLRPAIAPHGAATADLLTALADGSAVQPSVPPAPQTIEAFERLAASSRDIAGMRALLVSVLRQAREAKPPQSAVDRRDARAKVADYAAYCTFAGIASLQTRITR